MRIFAALLITVFTSLSAFAWEPRFEFGKFPSSGVYTGKTTELFWDESLFSFRVMFFSGITYEDMAEDPSRRFAGHYVMVTTYCGTARCGVLVDRRSGHVAALLPVATSGYDYRPDSNLLIINPFDGNMINDQPTFTYYFVRTKRGWKEIGRDEWPAPKPLVVAAKEPILPASVAVLPVSR